MLSSMETLGLPAESEPEPKKGFTSARRTEALALLPKATGTHSICVHCAAQAWPSSSAAPVPSKTRFPALAMRRVHLTVFLHSHAVDLEIQRSPCKINSGDTQKEYQGPQRDRKSPKGRTLQPAAASHPVVCPRLLLSPGQSRLNGCPSAFTMASTIREQACCSRSA